MKQHDIENKIKIVKFPALLGDHTVTDAQMDSLKKHFISHYKITNIQNMCIEYKLINNCDLYRMVVVATCSVPGKLETVPGYFCTKWVVSVSHSNVYYLLIDEMMYLLGNMSNNRSKYVATKWIARMGKPRVKRRWIIG